MKSNFPTNIFELKKLRKKSLSVIDSLRGEALAGELAHLHNVEICISVIESNIPLDSHPSLIKKDYVRGLE